MTNAATKEKIKIVKITMVFWSKRKKEKEHNVNVNQY